MMVAATGVDVSIEDTLIQGNRATTAAYGSGGGIAASYSGNMRLENVTIYNNQGNYGGGIYNGGQYTGDQLRMTNVTIFSNSAQYSGGGLYVTYGNFVTATNVTIAGNRAISQTGGNIYNRDSQVALVNSIVSGGYSSTTNIPNNCDGDPTANINSLGHNIDSGNSCGLTGPLDQVNTNPLLASDLADNGGTLPTLALLEGSPAIDAGDDSICPGTDQRGVARPQGPHCDIGAFEYEPPSVETKVFLPIVMRPED